MNRVDDVQYEAPAIAGVALDERRLTTIDVIRTRLWARSLKSYVLASHEGDPGIAEVRADLSNRRRLFNRYLTGKVVPTSQRKTAKGALSRASSVFPELEVLWTLPIWTIANPFVDMSFRTSQSLLTQLSPEVVHSFFYGEDLKPYSRRHWSTVDSHDWQLPFHTPALALDAFSVALLLCREADQAGRLHTRDFGRLLLATHLPVVARLQLFEPDPVGAAAFCQVLRKLFIEVVADADTFYVEEGDEFSKALWG